MTNVDVTGYVVPLADQKAQLQLLVEGVHCSACISRIEKGLRELDGMHDARLNFTTRRLAVTFDAARLASSRIMSTIESLGYRAFPFEHDRAVDSEAAHGKWLLRCVAVAGFAAMNVMLLSVSVWSGNASDISPETRDMFHGVSALIALPAVAYAGQPFFRSALAALRRRQLNMDVPISLGVLLACAMSVIETINHAHHAYFDSAVMLLFFLLCGRYLDHAARGRTRNLAANLAAMKPRSASRLTPDGVAIVPASALNAGDRVLVAPGDRIPADGRVIDGYSEADESLITGETTHRKIEPGDLVYASSINFNGALTVEVSAAGGDTLVDEIERLVEKAATAKSMTMRLADRVSRAYAPVVHLTAFATLMGWLISGATMHDAVVTAIAVLIITCPCALALAVPAVQIVASGLMFKQGILLNSGDLLERLASIDTVIFDKTGTLTLPDPTIVNIADIAPATVVKLARVALSSSHPLARALATRARGTTPVAGAIETAGQGVQAIIDGVEYRIGSTAFCGTIPDDAKAATTSSIAFRAGDDTGILHFEQSLRHDAHDVITQLRRQGLDLRILSGDHEAAVETVASSLGIANWKAECKPAEKIALIESLRKQGRKVLMVGDGMNDAPALAAANASLSPITASDLTQAHADAVFLGDGLRSVAVAFQIARKARSTMIQNLALALIYNLIAVPLAIAGFVTPLIAAAAMSGSSILVTLNAIRLRYPELSFEGVLRFSASGRMHWPLCCS